MVYADPPYSNTEAGYNAYWKKDDDDKLYNYLLDIDRKGSSFMISGVLNHNGETCRLLTNLIEDKFNYKVLMLGAVASISSKFLLGIAAATISTIIASVVVVEVMNTQNKTSMEFLTGNLTNCQTSN